MGKKGGGRATLQCCNMAEAAEGKMIDVITWTLGMWKGETRCYNIASEAAEDKVVHIITWTGKRVTVAHVTPRVNCTCTWIHCILHRCCGSGFPLNTGTTGQILHVFYHNMITAFSHLNPSQISTRSPVVVSKGPPSGLWGNRASLSCKAKRAVCVGSGLGNARSVELITSMRKDQHCT